jgi:hypothetical protein
MSSSHVVELSYLNGTKQSNHFKGVEGGTPAYIFVKDASASASHPVL